MKDNVADELNKMLEDTTHSSEADEVQQVIEGVKGKPSFDQGTGFWTEKTPCWEMCHCPDMIKNECPVFVNQSEACWAVEGTYCKLCEYGTRGDDISICKVCRVYKRYGEGQPIELKVRGIGITNPLQTPAKK